MKVEYEGKTYNISTHKHKQFKKRLANKQLTVQQNQEWLESMEQFYQNDAEKFSQSDSTDKTILIVILVVFVIIMVIFNNHSRFICNTLLYWPFRHGK